MNCKVIFLETNDPAGKLQHLYKTAERHFLAKEPLHILAPDKTVLEFVDALLWRLPEESFLPHAIASAPTQELVIITTERTILNNAVAVFNLCPTAFLDSPIKTIYDFDDRTSPERQAAANLRYQTYRGAGLPITNTC